MKRPKVGDKITITGTVKRVVDGYQHPDYAEVELDGQVTPVQSLPSGYTTLVHVRLPKRTTTVS